MAKKKVPEGVLQPPEGLQYLTCKTLGDLDKGFVEAVIDKALADAISDANDRGLLDGKARKVTIEVSFLKTSDDEMKIGTQVTTKIPPLKPNPTHAYTTNMRRNEPGVLFRPDNPERADQPTIPFEGKTGTDE